MIRAVVIAAVVAIGLAGCAGSHAPGVAGGAGVEAARSGLWERIGESREGRALEARTWDAAGGALRVYIVGGIHGNEAEGQQVVAELERRLGATRRHAAAGDWAGGVRILRDMNPDGTSLGRRGNAAGVDLNRNWPASNFRAAMRRGESALSEPEAAAALADMIGFRPDVILVLHSIGSGPFVNFDGPGAELAARFASAAAAMDGRWRVVADMGYATPGSMGSYWGVDRGIPILTIEMARGEQSAAGVRAVVRGIEAVCGGLSWGGEAGVVGEKHRGRSVASSRRAGSSGIAGEFGSILSRPRWHGRAP